MLFVLNSPILTINSNYDSTYVYRRYKYVYSCLMNTLLDHISRRLSGLIKHIAFSLFVSCINFISKLNILQAFSCNDCLEAVVSR